MTTKSATSRADRIKNFLGLIKEGSIKSSFKDMGVKRKPAVKASDVEAWELIKSAIFEIKKGMDVYPCLSQRIISNAVGVAQTTIWKLLNHKTRGNTALDLLRRICVSDKRYKAVVPIVEKAQGVLDGE